MAGLGSARDHQEKVVARDIAQELWHHAVLVSVSLWIDLDPPENAELSVQ